MVSVTDVDAWVQCSTQSDYVALERNSMLLFFFKRFPPLLTLLRLQIYAAGDKNCLFSAPMAKAQWNTTAISSVIQTMGESGVKLRISRAKRNTTCFSLLWHSILDLTYSISTIYLLFYRASQDSDLQLKAYMHSYNYCHSKL